MRSCCSNKFKLNKINDGYELIYSDNETGVRAELKLRPERTEDFQRKLQLVGKLVRLGVLQIQQFKHDYVLQKFLFG
jgi:hypothetical protein